jgi:hypothetical protein
MPPAGTAPPDQLLPTVQSVLVFPVQFCAAAGSGAVAAKVDARRQAGSVARRMSDRARLGGAADTARADRPFIRRGFGRRRRRGETTPGAFGCTTTPSATSTPPRRTPFPDIRE